MINSIRPHVLISSELARNKLPIVDLKGFDKCDQHKKSLKFFCKDDNEMCCSTCAIIGHRNCKSVIEIATFRTEDIIQNCLKEKEKLVELKEKNSLTISYLDNAVKT